MLCVQDRSLCFYLRDDLPAADWRIDLDLFSRKKQNTEDPDELEIRDSDLYLKPKKETRPAKVYGLLFILLCAVALVVLLISDKEPEEEPEEPQVLISAAEEPEENLQEIGQEESAEELLTGPVNEPEIPDYNQQPGQATVEYRRYEINTVIYEIRNDAAFVVGTVGNRKSIKYLTIESSVRYMYPVVEICEGAFRDCTKLLRVHIPDSVLIIRESAFENCSRLELVRMSKGLITMEGRVFAGCAALKSLEFPATVKELRADVFEGAAKLTKLKIPESCRIPEGEDPFGLGEKLKIEFY